MADPFSLAALLVGSGMKIAWSIARYQEEQKRSKLETDALRKRIAQQSAVVDHELEKRQQQELRRRITDAASSDILLVLIILGQRLLALELVNLQHVSVFNTLVEQNLPDQEWKLVHEKLDQTLKFTAAIGIYFCAECAPMHIYHGFGAAVLNNWRWASFEIQQGEDSQETRLVRCVAKEMDDMLVKLKSIPRSPLLTKVPKGVATVTPEYVECDLRKIASDKNEKRSTRKQAKKAIELMEGYNADVSRLGPPPLKDGTSFEAGRIFWATWDSPFACKDVWKDLIDVTGQQSDPGRLLYAFTIGGFLDLRPGEIVSFYDNHIEGLVRWLHGCPGMTFRLVENSERSYKDYKLSKSTRKGMEKIGIDIEKEMRSTFDSLSVMYDPAIARKQSEATQNIVTGSISTPQSHLGSISDQGSYFTGSPPSYQASATPATSPDWSPRSPNTGTLPIRRRAAPAPPRASLRKAKAIHDFDAVDQGELSMKLGEMLDVLNQMDDGWIEVRRLDGTVGVVPESFTSSVLTP